MNDRNHPLTESAAAELWDTHAADTVPWDDWYGGSRRALTAMLRAAFDAGREHERTANADQDWREAEKLRTDIAESDAETLYKRCERVREERDVFFRQCEYALDRAEKAEADLAERERAADEDDRPWEPLNGPLNVGDEVRQERPGLTITGVVGRVDAEDDPWTADDIFIGEINVGTWYVRRAASTLPTEDGAVIVPAEGREFIEAVVNGHTYYAREAMLINGLWRAAWRTPHCFQVSYSVLPWKITPGTWKVDDQ